MTDPLIISAATTTAQAIKDDLFSVVIINIPTLLLCSMAILSIIIIYVFITEALKS